MLSDSKFQLKQAEENLSRTRLNLERLGEKAMELVNMAIATVFIEIYCERRADYIT